MKARSPVLGYNHNVRYAGRLWHVQTEDSGVNNPHIFTHLFHEGTILATKRSDYEAAAEVSLVQKLMQVQHKAMLRELKAGAFDDKIGKFLGAPVVRDAVPEPAEAEPADLAATVVTPANAGQTIEMPVVFDTPAANAPVVDAIASTRPPREATPTQPTRVPPIEPAPPQAAPPQAAAPQAAPPQAARPVPMQPRQTVGTPMPMTAPRAPTIQPAHPVAARATPQIASGKPTADGIVIARPAVMVGAEITRPVVVPPAARPAVTVSGGSQSSAPSIWDAPKPAAKASDPKPAPDSIFGADLISEKSLDEVILAYLSEDLEK